MPRYLQVAAFIDSTSDVDTAGTANSNLYYVNTFSGSVSDTTGSFRTNADMSVSDGVLSLATSGGSTRIIAGISDLTSAFTALPSTSEERIAIVFTDGQDSRTNLESTAAELKAEGVTVAAVGIGFVATDALELIASERADGSEIVFTGSTFDDITELFSDVILSIGALSQ